MKYQVGQQVWRATWEARKTYLTCPHCEGTGHIRFLNPDDSIGGAIDCANCTRGYDPPSGKICVYERRPVAEPTTINGMNVDAEKVEYHTTGSYLVRESHLFEREDEALAFAAEMCAEEDRKERAQVARKEKDTRSWAWNVSYHRGCIKRAEKEIAYHTAKLNVARIKAKEPAAA
jgi:hypothetical protein